LRCDRPERRSHEAIFRVISPDKHVLEMFNDGEKAMEITYTRA